MTRRIAATCALLALLGGGGRVHALGQVELSIATWTAAYHLDPAWVTRILECESSLNPSAYNPSSGAGGVAQWEAPSYWEELAALNNDTTLAPGLSVFDPEQRGLWDADAAIHVMAHALFVGHAWRWECA